MQGAPKAIPVLCAQLQEGSSVPVGAGGGGSIHLYHHTLFPHLSLINHHQSKNPQNCKLLQAHSTIWNKVWPLRGEWLSSSGAPPSPPEFQSAFLLSCPLSKCSRDSSSAPEITAPLPDFWLPSSGKLAQQLVQQCVDPRVTQHLSRDRQALRSRGTGGELLSQAWGC